MHTFLLTAPFILNIYIAAFPSDWLQYAENQAMHGRYNTAASIYRLLLAQGFASSELDYNMGVCALAQGDLGAAIFHLRRAKESEPLNQRLSQALSKARRFVAEAPAPPKLYRVLSFWTYCLAATHWIIGWILLAGYHFRHGRRCAVIGLVILSTSLVWLTLSAYSSAEERRAPWAVVRQRCEVRTGNGESYPTILRDGKPVTVHPGWEVSVLGQRSNHWVYIAVAGEPVGWLPSSCLYLSATPVQWQ